MVARSCALRRLPFACGAGFELVNVAISRLSRHGTDVTRGQEVGVAVCILLERNRAPRSAVKPDRGVGVQEVQAKNLLRPPKDSSTAHSWR